MELFDLSELAELSTIGLVADKILFELDQHPKDDLPEYSRLVFKRAEGLLAQAITGLRCIDDWIVARDTALAVGTYEIVTSAWQSYEEEPEEIGRTKVFLNLIKTICEKAAIDGKVTDKDKLRSFFKALSEFTAREHSALLRGASKVTI